LVICEKGLNFPSSTFQVGLTNSDPAVTMATQQGYVVCGQAADGLTANGSTVTLQCPQGMPPSRYLIVQKLDAGMMVICEVEVYTQGAYLQYFIDLRRFKIRL
jgi:hypothetical protein